MLLPLGGSLSCRPEGEFRYLQGRRGTLQISFWLSCGTSSAATHRRRPRPDLEPHNGSVQLEQVLGANREYCIYPYNMRSNAACLTHFSRSSRLIRLRIQHKHSVLRQSEFSMFQYCRGNVSIGVRRPGLRRASRRRQFLTIQ